MMATFMFNELTSYANKSWSKLQRLSRFYSPDDFLAPILLRKTNDEIS